MRRGRVTIARLMAIIVLVAIGIAAIRHSDRAWILGSAAIVMTILLAATFQAALGSGRTRNFWFGFAAIGWAHIGVLQGKYAELLPTVFLTNQSVAYASGRMSDSNLWSQRAVAANWVWLLDLGEIALLWETIVLALFGGLLAAGFGGIPASSVADVSTDAPRRGD